MHCRSSGADVVGGTRVSQWRISILLLGLLALLPICLGQSTNPVPPAGCSAAQGTCVRIGYFACVTPDRCTDVIGYNEMFAWYRQRLTSIQGVPVYWVEAQQLNFFPTVVSVFNATIVRSWIGPDPAHPLIDYAILPLGSGWEIGMVHLEAARIPSISALTPTGALFQCGATDEAIQAQVGCKEKNSRRFQYVMGILNPGEQYLEPWVGQLKLHKARTLGVVRIPNPFYPSVRAGLIAAASDNHIRVTYDKLVPDNSPEVAVSTIAELVALAEDDQPDGLAIITSNCINWVKAMKAANYAPKSVTAILCSDGVVPYAELGADLDYIVGSAQWAVGLGGTDYTENADTQPWALFPHIRNEETVNETSPLQFQALFRRLIGDPTAVPGYAEAGVLIAPNILEAAMTLAGSVDPELVNAQLKIFYQPSYFGLITTNRFGQNNQKQMVLVQRDEFSVLELISPTSSATTDLVYPMPGWDERQYAPQMFVTTIERTLLALLLVCCLFTCALMAYIFAHRRLEIFQAAGVPLYMMMGLGCLVAFVSILTWPVENNSATCDARIWLWTIAFLMVVNPILASSYRIARIYANTSYAGEIPNRTVFLIGSLLAVPQLIINCLWAGIAPLEPSVVTVDQLRPAFTSFTMCSQQGSEGMAFVGLTLAYCCLLLVSAVFLAYRIRNAYAMFNDAQPIAASIFLFALVAAVVLVVEIALNEDSVSSQRVLFGLRSVGVLLAYQGSIGMLFLRRIIDSRLAPSSVRHSARFAPKSIIKTRQNDVSTPRINAHPHLMGGQQHTPRLPPLQLNEFYQPSSQEQQQQQQQQHGQDKGQGQGQQGHFVVKRQLSFAPRLSSPAGDRSEDPDDERSHALYPSLPSPLSGGEDVDDGGLTSGHGRGGEVDGSGEFQFQMEEYQPHGGGGGDHSHLHEHRATLSPGPQLEEVVAIGEFAKDDGGEQQVHHHHQHQPADDALRPESILLTPLVITPSAPLPPLRDLRSLSTDDFIEHLAAFHALIQDQRRELQANQVELQRRAQQLRMIDQAIAAAAVTATASEKDNPPAEKDQEKDMK